MRLIGYCTEGSLFLVYEYIENGNLSQHLRGSGMLSSNITKIWHFQRMSLILCAFAGREPLPWSTRIQIALDSARGLEYIHEHTVPVYIHRDIKPANILIDKNSHAKVGTLALVFWSNIRILSLDQGCNLSCRLRILGWRNLLMLEVTRCQRDGSWVHSVTCLPSKFSGPSLCLADKYDLISYYTYLSCLRLCTILLSNLLNSKLNLSKLL